MTTRSINGFSFVVDPACPPDQVYFLRTTNFPVWVGPGPNFKEYFKWEDVPDHELLKARLLGVYGPKY